MTTTAPSGLKSDVILERLMHLHPKVIDLSLGRTLDLLEKLGRPQDRLPPVVHVAGTNGKGSTIAFTRAVAEAAGYRVHVYTSPHLVRFAERILLAGEQISEDALSALLETCEQANAAEPITFFEITTCAAMKAFSETPADLLLLEVGLGGRMDATNVVPKPACTAITPVSMDHMQYLGPTLEAIAGEKAAIQKRGVPSVVAPQDPVAMAVIEREAARVGAPLTIAAPVSDDTVLSLPGRHQRINAGMADAILTQLQGNGAFRFDAAARQTGYSNTVWPARLQRLTRGPIAEALGPDWEIWIDGGHNEAAGEALADMASGWRATDPQRPLYAVAGMLNTKEPTDFLAHLRPYLAGLQAVGIAGTDAALSPEDLVGFARALGIPAESAESVNRAVETLPRDRPGRLLITGSLYLAGLVLAENG
ncbi:MAG: folylpolyglutamate synthase/dihydrofolate synthase family protein [Alphaproteobacteria bacterium]